MKTKLIYIVVMIFFINLNINYALNKKAFLHEPTEEINTANHIEKKSNEEENKQEKNENEKSKFEPENSGDDAEEKNRIITNTKTNEENTQKNNSTPSNRPISTEEIKKEHSRNTDIKNPDKTSPVKDEVAEKPKSDEKNDSNVNKLKPEVAERNRVNEDLKRSEDGSQKKELPKPLNNNNENKNNINNNIINNENKNKINNNEIKNNLNKNINNNENKNNDNKNNINKNINNNNNDNKNNINDIKNNSDNKIELSRTADSKGLENNPSVKPETGNKPKSDEKKDNVVNRVKLPEKSDKVEAPLEKTTILHPVSYHRDALVMNPTPMISSATRVAATVVGPSCVTPFQTVITPAITSAILPPPGIVRETTIISTPITPTLPIPLMQRNLRVTEMAAPVQAVQAFGTPIANVYSTSPFAPVNRSMGFSTAFAPQPPVIQKTFTQNTINGVPVGPPLINTVITPPPQIANRIISQYPVGNGAMSPSPLMMNRMVSPNPFINGVMSPSPIMMNRIVNTPVVNGMVSPAPMTMMNRMVTSAPVINGFANSPIGNDVYVFR